MLTPIPNQPLSFTPSRILGCNCDDPRECLLANRDDVLSFQMLFDGDVFGTQLLANSDMSDDTAWPNSQWNFTGEARCAVASRSLGALSDTTFSPTPGITYVVRVTANGPTFSADAIQVLLGNSVAGTIIGPQQTYTWIVTATNTDPLTFQLINPVSGTPGIENLCIDNAFVYVFDPDLTVSLVDLADNTIGAFDYSTHPALFDFTTNEGRVTVSFDITAFEDDAEVENGCYTLLVESGTQELQSQCVTFADEHACTLTIRACNAAEAIGLAGFIPTMRIHAKIVRPRYEYTVGEERGTDGTLNRYYASRTRTLELRIDGLGERGHEFISTLPLYDHVYFQDGTNDAQEYAVGKDAYEPAYSDVFDATGGILIKITPKTDPAYKVRTVEDSGGCAPPPNYLVQGTGPNEDYITQTNGDLILLNQ